MARDTGEESGNGNRSAEEAALSARLQSLGERLAQQKGPGPQAEARSGSKSDPSALARGFRLSTELVAGVLVGAFIGWALDKWLGISPWGMIVFLLLGFAAGVINVMRAAGVSSGRQAQGDKIAGSFRRWPIRFINLKSTTSCTLGHIGGHEIAFTNSALFMAITVVGICGAAGRRQLGRARWCRGGMQSIAELSYEFVADTINSTAGKEGMKFFPLVFTLFMFILVANIIGLIPYTFTVTSHIIITAALALLVFLTVLVYGFYKNGLRFFRLFVPQRHPDLHPAADRVHRGAVVPVAADLAQRASVRQHAGRPHHAQGVRELHHAARAASAFSASSARPCRWRWWWR